MILTRLCKTICNRHLLYDVTKGWQTALQEEFEPLRPYFRPMDRLARLYPGKNDYEPYRIVIHRDGTIVGVDNEDYDNRIFLSREDIVLYEFDRALFRRSLCDALGFRLNTAPLSESERTIPVGTWEPEKSAHFSVYLLLPGPFMLRNKVFERIVEKDDFGEILLLPPRNQWDDSSLRAAQKNNILLVPLDEVLCLKDGRISATPQWNDYLQAFGQMVDVALPSRYCKPVRDYVFARRDEEWFLQYGEKTSTLELELLGPPFVQHLLKYPNQKIHVQQLWFEVMGPSGSGAKINDDTTEWNSLLSDGEEMLDRTAREKYRARLMELSGERAEATENNDVTELERINTEFEMIESVLKSSFGLRGREIKIGDEVIKLRDRIRRLMSTVFKKLGKSNPGLAQYLKNSIECGVHAIYKPSEEVSWKFE